MGKVLYRKYRSRSFDEIVGQQHITDTLKQAIKSSVIAHAYLFTGPRGVGKTSVARILAYAVNDIPYQDDLEHLDIIEIDAASNRRIDEIRDLREKVHIAPAIAKYKVYIIDEVHMLTNEAFNALLKTLEEPPAHVIFILATTESHKLPETIISRTQRFSFRPVEPEVMSEHLKNIAQKEKINVEPSALTLMSEHARGSFRDALTILDQLRTHQGNISVDAVENLLGLAPQNAIEGLLDRFVSAPPREVFDMLARLLEQGVSSQNAAKAVSRLARDKMLADPSLIPVFLPLVERLLDVEGSLDARLRLEAAIAASLPKAVTLPKTEALETPVIEVKPPITEVEPTIKKAQNPEPPAKKPKGEFDWAQLLAAAKSQSEPVYALLRMAHPELAQGGSNLTLRFRFAFHAKRLDNIKHQSIFRDLLSLQFNDVPEVVIIHDPSVSAEPTNKTLTAVADILDGEIIDL